MGRGFPPFKFEQQLQSDPLYSPGEARGENRSFLCETPRAESSSAEPFGSSSVWQSPSILLESSVLSMCFTALGDGAWHLLYQPGDVPVLEGCPGRKDFPVCSLHETSPKPDCHARLLMGTLLCLARACSVVRTGRSTAEHQRVQPELLPDKRNFTNPSFLLLCLMAGLAQS